MVVGSNPTWRATLFLGDIMITAKLKIDSLKVTLKISEEFEKALGDIEELSSLPDSQKLIICNLFDSVLERELNEISELDLVAQ